MKVDKAAERVGACLFDDEFFFAFLANSTEISKRRVHYVVVTSALKDLAFRSQIKLYEINILDDEMGGIHEIEFA